jgi:ATP-dependent DNA helicase RecG
MAYPLFHWSYDGPLPMVLSPEEFATAFPGESELVEFKQGPSADKIQASAAAFSNTDGGVILVGVDASGRVVGYDLDGEAEAKLHRILRDVHEPGRYDIRSVQVGDKHVAVISVDRRREGFAQTRDGAVLVRRGAMNARLFGAELREFVSRRSLGTFEATDVDVPLADAPSLLIDRLVDAWGWAAGDVAARLVEHGLACDGGRDGPHLTVAGALYLLPHPEEVLGKAYVEIFRYPGAGARYNRRIRVDGPLDAQVERTTAAIADELGGDLVVLGTRRYDLPRLPVEVLREAVANALAHRSYEMKGTAVRVEIRPDDVKITSPGGLPEPVTVRNIRDQQAARNRYVLETLRRYHLAEDAGRGVDVMQDVMQANMLQPPVFEDLQSSVVVTLRLGSTVTPRERAWLTELEHRGELQPSDAILLVRAARGETLTNSAVRQVLGVDSVIARQRLQRLRDLGLLIQRGKRGGAEYHLAGQLSPPAGLRLRDDQLEDLVVHLATEQPVTNALVRARTGLDRTEVLRILDALVASGRLLRLGERRGVRYVLPSEYELPLDDVPVGPTRRGDRPRQGGR